MCLLAVPLNSHAHLSNPLGGNVPLYHCSRAVCQVLTVSLYRPHIFLQLQAVFGAPPPRHQVFSLLHDTWCNYEHCHSSTDFWGTKHFCSWWSNCLPPKCTKAVSSAFKDHPFIHNSTPVTDTIKEAESTFKKLILIKTKKLLIINKFIKQWFSYINKLISVYQILITFNFMSMFTWVMKYNLFTYYNK